VESARAGGATRAQTFLMTRHAESLTVVVNRGYHEHAFAWSGVSEPSLDVHAGLALYQNMLSRFEVCLTVWFV